jgi:hypothetical protein
VTWKSGVGSYSYHATKRRAVIAAGTNSSTLSYEEWRNRSEQVAISGGSTETTISVAGLLEKVSQQGSVTEYRHRIAATPGVVAIYTRRSVGSPLSDTYYVHRDHLGGPELITEVNGTAWVGLSFSAYGERRDADWDGPIGSTDSRPAAPRRATGTRGTRCSMVSGWCTCRGECTTRSLADSCRATRSSTRAMKARSGTGCVVQTLWT